MSKYTVSITAACGMFDRFMSVDFTSKAKTHGGVMRAAALALAREMACGTFTAFDVHGIARIDDDGYKWMPVDDRAIWERANALAM